MSGKYQSLVEISELMHLRAMELFRQRREAVARTDSKLAEIRMMREAAQADTESVDARRMSGSDTMWQGWMAVRTTQLQQEMAINRALELEGLVQSRNSFARLDAATTLEKEERLAARKLAAKRQEERLDWLGLMKNWPGD